MLSSAARAPVGRPAGTRPAAAMMRAPALARIHTAPGGRHALGGRQSPATTPRLPLLPSFAPVALARPPVAASAAAAAAVLSTASPASPDLTHARLQRLCKTLLVGFAATALWSVLASATGGGGGAAEPLLASMSFAVGGTASASGKISMPGPCTHAHAEGQREEEEGDRSVAAAGGRRQKRQGHPRPVVGFAPLRFSPVLAIVVVFLSRPPSHAFNNPPLARAKNTPSKTTPKTAAASSATTAQSAWAGLAAGFLHTLCGPDHLAALAPLTIRHSRGTASALGALWGFGHSTGQLILGLVFVLLKERFHDFAPALSRWSGVVVGLTLVAIGVMGLYETYVEGNSEEGGGGHGGELPLALAGADGNGGNGGGKAGKGGSAGLVATTYATGIVYGLQPDALFVVIPALALPTKLAAVAYCAAFVVGTVAAMGGYTAAISTSSSALTKDRPWLQAHLSAVASAVALGVGALVLAAGLGLNVPLFGGG